MHSPQQSRYKILCSKNDVILKRELQNDNNNNNNNNNNNTASNTFVIDFEINNSRIDLERFCNFNIFKLMFELNREDAIQDLCITDRGDSDGNINNVKDVLLVFKRKGDDVGIKQKYMNLRLTLTTTTAASTSTATSAFASNFVFECVDAELDAGNGTGIDLSRAERICDIGAVFCMSLLDRNRLRMQFMFSVPTSPATKRQPSYIENSLGMVMKKILSRVKTFIEQM